MDGPRNQFLTGPAFAGDQYPARLRRHRLDELEDGAHLGALPDDVVQSREPAQLAAKITCLFFPSEAVRYSAYGAAQLVDQLMILNHVAIGAGIDCRDCSFQ